MKRNGRPRKKDSILEGKPFFSPQAQLKPWISNSPGKRFQPQPKKPRLKMDATLSRFLVFGLAPGAALTHPERERFRTSQNRL